MTIKIQYVHNINKTNLHLLDNLDIEIEILFITSISGRFDYSNPRISNLPTSLKYICLFYNMSNIGDIDSCFKLPFNCVFFNPSKFGYESTLIKTCIRATPVGHIENSIYKLHPAIKQYLLENNNRVIINLENIRSDTIRHHTRIKMCSTKYVTSDLNIMEENVFEDFVY